MDRAVDRPTPSGRTGLNDAQDTMLGLSDVTLIAIDTANHALALRALARSRADVQFARTLFLTNERAAEIDVPDGIEIATIGTLESREAYSEFVLKGLSPYVATTHALLVQWDGYVINPLAWEAGFLNCDYIGAKWFWQPEGRRVGNGGFSLRSRRLIEALQDPRIVLRENEDLTIGAMFRPLLEAEHGIRFADEAMADRFAFEAAYPIAKPFGFHGLFNFCRVVPPDELTSLAEHFSDAIAKSLQFAQLIRNCIALGQWHAAIALARRRLTATPQDAETERLLRDAETAARTTPAAGRNDPCPCGSGKRFKHCHGSLTAPLSADDLAQRGLTAHRREDIDAAEREYRAALALSPDHPLALHYLGVIAYQRGRALEAWPLLDRAAQLRPDEPEFHNNLGLTLVELDRHDEAIDAYRRALTWNSTHATAWNNLGLALTGCNRLPEAIDALRRALVLRPDFGEAHWNLALALLAHGEFAEGWGEYEWRLSLRRLAGLMQTPATPRWNGEDIAGKSLLLTADQGLGDTLQFIRFAQLVAARGARVLVEAPTPLVRLLATAPGVTEVRAAGDPLPTHDVHVPLLSVAGALGINETNIPAGVPYLHVDNTHRRLVADEVMDLARRKRKVGIAWAGARHNTNDRRRSCSLALLSSLFDIRDVAWFSLQKGDGEEEIAAVPNAERLVRLDARNDFDRTAALVATMDLVISVDTSIAHLAGALARPTWILLPFAPDWRWRTAGNETPWYPTVRLFRQPRRGDWASIVAEVQATLTHWLAHA
jgi:tetratricopeptide (TPR) repeat protein